MNLSLEYPVWYVLVCLAIAAFFSWLLYGKRDVFPEMNPWLKKLIAAFRFLSLFLISFLLLSPLLATNHREVQKPKLVFLRDNSSSITAVGKKSYYEKEFVEEWSQLKSQLESKFDVSSFVFDEEISANENVNYNGKVTNLSAVVSQIRDRFSNQNLGAIVLATDGIYNQGNNPVFVSKELGVPIYAVGLGDTLPKKDLLINLVSHNKYAYLGNNFPLEITVEAKLCQGLRSVIQVIDESGQVKASQDFQIAGNRFQKQFSFMLKAEKVGMQRYSIRLQTIKGEVTTSNNTAEAYIEVLDGRQKVLLVYANPHPDIAALKNSIEANQSYEVETSSALNLKKKLEAYNLVIFHGIPAASGEGQNCIQELLKTDVPALFVVSSSSSIPNFNQLGNGVSIQTRSNTTNETQAIFNRNFALFSLSPELTSQLEKFPPLLSPYGDFKSSPGAQTLLFQKIGTVNTENPLLVFGQNGNRKMGSLLGENCWKWRLADFNQNKSTRNFDELVSKIVQYLAVKQDKSQFRIITKNKFQENESVLFEGEIYNDSYELINQADINLMVSNSKGKKYQFVLGKTDKSYRLDAGVFPPGVYSYEASTKMGDKLLKANGKFVVSEIKLEFTNITADHQLLRTMSLATHGKFYLPKDMKNISDEIQKSENLKPVIYNYSTFDEAIHLKWIFGLIILLLALEWFVRKWGGAY